MGSNNADAIPKRAVRNMADLPKNLILHSRPWLTASTWY